MTVSKDLLLAILAMDSYNRGYGEGIAGLGGVGSFLGTAEIKRQSQTSADSPEVAAGFYALSYTLNEAVGDMAAGSTVISYRGTDISTISSLIADVVHGWFVIPGSPVIEQGYLAAEFFQAVTGTDATDPRTGDAILTGHSLGGALAGLVGPFKDKTVKLAARDGAGELSITTLAELVAQAQAVKADPEAAA